MKVEVLDVQYDPHENKARVLSVAEDGRLVSVLVNNHSSWFLTDASEKCLQRLLAEGLILRYKRVKRTHPITRKPILLWRVEVKSPLDVRRVRSTIERECGAKYWEADIEYVLRVVIDFGLYPGATYPGRVVQYSFEEAVNTPMLLDQILDNALVFDIEVGNKTAVSFPKATPSDLRQFIHDVGVHTKLLKDAEKWLEWSDEVLERLDKEGVAEDQVIAISVATKERREVWVLRKRRLTQSLYDMLKGREPEEDLCDLSGQEVLTADGQRFKVRVFESEEEMLAEFWRLASEKRIWVGYNSSGFDLPYLFYRSIRLGVIPPPLLYVRTVRAETGDDHVLVAPYPGIHIDLYHWFSNSTVKNYVHGNKYKQFSLDAVAEAVLGLKKVSLPLGMLPSSLRCSELVKYSATDVWITWRLFEADLEVMLMLARVTRMPLSFLHTSGVSKWVKQILLWEHYYNGFLFPRKDELDYSPAVTESKTGKQYSGAFVLEPPTGVFFDVVDMDFASLYPSIIERYNIGYDTVDNPHLAGKCRNWVEVVEPETGRVIHKICQDVPSIVAQAISRIKALRLKYKRLAKDPSVPEEDRKRYSTIQSALKVIINASYGVLGNKSFSLFLPGSAESVTTLGRATILDMLSYARSIGAVVLYTDTDSMFLWSPSEEQVKLLQKRAKEKHGIELDVDEVFSWVLFSGIKKNYVGRTADGRTVVKGMMGMKVDTPEAFRKLFYSILEVLGKAEGPEELFKAIDKAREMYEEYRDRLLRYEIPPEELAVKKKLNKSLEEYDRNIPHVLVARNLEARYGLRFKKGDVVQYLKIDGGYAHPLEFQLNPSLKYSVKEYLKSLNGVLTQLFKGLGIALNSTTVKTSSLLSYFPSAGQQEKVSSSTPKVLSKPKKQKTLKDILGF